MGSAASAGKRERKEERVVVNELPATQANDVETIPECNALLNPTFVRVFTNAGFLTMCPIKDLLRLFKLLSKEASELFENNEAATWYSACYSLARMKGLYMPVERSGPVLSWKKFFHANLWPARNKWMATSGEESSGTVPGTSVVCTNSTRISNHAESVWIEIPGGIRRGVLS